MASQSWWLRRIEEKAYDRLRELRRRRLWDGAPPVPVDHVVEHALNLRITWERIDEGPDELILASLRPAMGEVVLNEKHVELFRSKPGLERFSKGHEAGHADLFALVGEADQFSLLAKHAYRPIHRSATNGEVVVLAQRLSTLPADVRNEVIRELAVRERERRAYGQDSPLERRAVDHYAAVLLMPEDLFRSQTRDLDLEGWPSLYSLAESFGVTISAVIVRLKELRLIHDVEGKTIMLRDPAAAGQGLLL